MQGSLRRFENRIRRDAGADFDKQRTIIAPILRVVFSLTSLVGISDFFEVSPYSSYVVPSDVLVLHLYSLILGVIP